VPQSGPPMTTATASPPSLGYRSGLRITVPDNGAVIRSNGDLVRITVHGSATTLAHGEHLYVIAAIPPDKAWVAGTPVVMGHKWRVTLKLFVPYRPVVFSLRAVILPREASLGEEFDAEESRAFSRDVAVAVIRQ